MTPSCSTWPAWSRFLGHSQKLRAICLIQRILDLAGFHYHHVQQIQRRPREALPVQTGRQQQEQASADHDVLVALPARLEQLHGRHQNQQCRAGAQAIESAKSRKHGADECHGQQGAHGAARQPDGADGGGEAPRDQ